MHIISFIFCTILVILAMIITDLMRSEIMFHLGPNLTRLGNRFIIGRVATREDEPTIKENVVKPNSPLTCQCDEIIGSEGD
jgi:hypothetical protein